MKDKRLHINLLPWTIALLCLIALCPKLVAQDDYILNLVAKDKASDFVSKEIKWDKKGSDSLSLNNQLKRVLLSLYDKAYLEASVDSIGQQDSIYTAYLHIGETYKWASLKNGNVEDAFLEEVGFRERIYENKPFYYQEVTKIQEALLEYAENNGYPFANVWLDSIQIDGVEIEAQLFMKKNRLVLFDGIDIRGDVKISENYLENYLGLKKGTPFSLEKVKKIKNRIKELAFLKEIRDATITFRGEKAIVNIFVNKKKASRWDFLFGFLPNTNSLNPSDPNSRRFLFTATLNGEFQNQFGKGERLFLEFERLRPETQKLDLEFAYPYLLDLPFGVDMKFGQYRRDSTFRDIIFDLGIQYLFEGGNYIKAFWNNSSSDLLSVNTDQLQFGKTPNRLDISNSSFGLEYYLQRLDYRFNPRKGWSIRARGGAGVKRIVENNTILEVFPDFYDSLAIRSIQYKVDVLLEYYIPLFKRSVLKTAVQGGFLLSENPIFENEQYRLGGNRLLRGFDEQSIFASRFAMMTLEYRFIIGTNSYLYLFGDYAYVEDVTATRRQFDRPLGFGTGITFETGVGVFGLSYALGRRFNNPINFSAAKIHFGYVSFF